MKITYDLEVLPERRSGGRKSEETLAVIAFLAGNQKNMCIEYDDEKQAKRKYDSLRGYRLVNKLQEVFDLYRHENCIYVIKTKRGGKKA